jgi:DNA polymerase I-like protein with 3'-5' exonuclease and polymerase domains
MLLVFDAAQLEWRAVAHLSEDKIAIQEILNGVDFHSDNQRDFKLPERLVAKKFLFRNIYCPYWSADKTAYAYSVDDDFKHIGGRKFWRIAIGKFYEKYEGIHNYHIKLMQEATTTGQIVSGTGRIYEFEPKLRRGEMKWPENDIVNYPVSGFSADLMSMIRVSAFNRLKGWREAKRCLFVNTVHDNIVLDLRTDIRGALEVAKIAKSCFQDCGGNYKKLYGKELLVPMDTDCKVGNNYLWMHKINVAK